MSDGIQESLEASEDDFRETQAPLPPPHTERARVVWRHASIPKARDLTDAEANWLEGKLQWIAWHYVIDQQMTGDRRVAALAEQRLQRVASIHALSRGLAALLQPLKTGERDALVQDIYYHAPIEASSLALFEQLEYIADASGKALEDLSRPKLCFPKGQSSRVRAISRLADVFEECGQIIGRKVKAGTAYPGIESKRLHDPRENPFTRFVEGAFIEFLQAEEPPSGSAIALAVRMRKDGAVNHMAKLSPKPQ